MVYDSIIFENFFKKKLSKISSEFRIDYIIQIQGEEDLNTEKIEEITIRIRNRQTNIKNKFYLPNDENLSFKEKLKFIVKEGIKKKFIKKDSKILFLFDNSISEEYSLGMIILDVSKLIYRIARFKLAEFLEQESILEKILETCDEIRNEGREGKKIGTLFVIGNEEELKDYSKQLILNPFYGYPKELTNILTNDLTETIKEYSQLDGGFIINNEGNIISAGTYIKVDTSEVKKYYGWGTKHLAAVAITQKTKSIAILVSESGGRIKIFKGGKLILKY